MYAVVVNQQKSLGFDWEHVYYVQAAVLPNESVECDTASRSDDEVTAEYLEFYNRLQHHPVESACYTLMHFHYIWKNGSGTMSYDTLKTSAMYRGSHSFLFYRVSCQRGLMNVRLKSCPGGHHIPMILW